MALLASLVTRLSLESSSFSTGMKKARRQAADDTSAIRKSVDSVNSKLNAFGAGLSLAAFGAVAKRALEYVSSLAEVAQQLGVTTKELQVFRFAGSQVGIATEQMDKALGKLSVNIGKAAAGSQQQAKFFSAMGISIRDTSGHVKTAGQVTLELADKLQKVGDSAQRNAAEVTAFGKSGQVLDTLLSGGSKAINEFAREAEKLGLVLSNKQIQDADALADKLSALKQVLEARIAGTIADNAQSILSLANSLSQLAVGIAKFWSQNPVKAMQIMGAMAGAAAGARFGIPGAVVGGTAGLVAGTFMAPQTPQSLRNMAADQLRMAQQNARGMGYVSGRRSRRDLEISRMPVVADPMRRAKELMAKATQLANSGSFAAPTAAGGGADLPKYLAGKTPKTHDHTEQREKEALRLAYEMDKEELDSKRDLLQSQQDLTNDYQARADQAKQIADLELQSKQRSIKFDLDMVVVDKTISEKQKEEAKARAEKANSLADQLHLNELVKIENDRELQMQRDANAMEDARFDARKDALQSEEQLATTAAERRKIELELLDIAYQQRKAALEHIRDDMMPNGFPSHTDAERAQAGADLKNLNAGYGSARQGVLQSTRGPLEAFLAGIPKTAAEANEALQSVAVEGLQSITDGLTDAIMGAKSLGKVFSNVAKQIVAELIKIQIQKAIVGPLANALGNIFSGSFGGSFGSTTVTGFAGGGYTGDGNPNSVAGPVHRREFVFDAAATRRLGVPTLEALSKGRPMMATGPGEGGGGIVVNQTFAPNLAGNAVDRMELVRWMALAKQDTMQAMRDVQRRKAR